MTGNDKNYQAMSEGAVSLAHTHISPAHAHTHMSLLHTHRHTHTNTHTRVSPAHTHTSLCPSFHLSRRCINFLFNPLSSFLPRRTLALYSHKRPTHTHTHTHTPL